MNKALTASTELLISFVIDATLEVTTLFYFVLA
jgi:hypothetical protein